MRRGSSAELLSALVLLLPLLAVPWAFKPYTANVLAVYMIYGLLAMSLGLIWGAAGIMSFGQTAFFGIGAYAYGAIGLNLINRTQQTHAALLGGLAAAALLAAIVGYFMFYGRISDVYASIITMALTLVLFAFAVSTGGDEWVIGVARLGGFNGMFGQGESSQNIANFQIPPVTLWLPGMTEPFAFKINRESAAGYYLVLGVSVAVYVLTRALVRSRLGRVAVAIRENEARVASLGYDTRFYKFALFTIPVRPRLRGEHGGLRPAGWTREPPRRLRRRRHHRAPHELSRRGRSLRHHSPRRRTLDHLPDGGRPAHRARGAAARPGRGPGGRRPRAQGRGHAAALPGPRPSPPLGVVAALARCPRLFRPPGRLPAG